MSIDHSLTYKKIAFRNLPHILRARAIVRAVDNIGVQNPSVYFDIGCSNGYLTNKIYRETSPSTAVGWDHSEDNLKQARITYDAIEFRYIDLNKKHESMMQADLVTCFETLEHVGDIPAALDNILSMTKTGGKILITVPIEVGFIGVIKYFIKIKIFRYSLSEISDNKKIWKKYKKALLTGKDISCFRRPKTGWGTHFGFDYRSMEKHLYSRSRKIEAWTYGTTRFYKIEK